MNLPRLRFKEFSGEWEEKKLESITKEKISYGIVQAGPHVNDGVPYIKSSNVGGAIDLNQLQRTSNAIHYKYRRSAVHPNDIVFSLRGNIGQVSIVPTEIVEANLTQGTARISVDDINDNKFVYFQMQTEGFLDGINARSKGSTFQEISLGDLRMVPIMQSSKPEQTKIANFLTGVDEKITQITQKADLLARYKKGVMQQLFSQQLRFKDDDGQNFPEWIDLKLADTSTIVGGGTPDTTVKEYWNGDIQWFTPTELKTKYMSKSLRTITLSGLKNSSAKVLPVGTLLFSSRATVGDISIALNECTTNQGFQSFIVNDLNCNKFIYYWILNNKNLFIEKASGSTFLEISKKEIEKLKIKTPSLPEQTKIANFLTSIDDKISHNQTQLNALKQYKQGLLQQLFV